MEHTVVPPPPGELWARLAPPSDMEMVFGGGSGPQSTGSLSWGMEGERAAVVRAWRR